ncbi:hypothetical protein [Paenisporosarcina sp. OV554]|uniref:hypothetical protein n=1 Tax=Paenisporosarcina sp. OV554 TaxID=2135694 RepID=UPI000D3B26A8|nr:hypothetical protein [Paenisporosarcina sp. OV554]PUB09461.1 hypothetical protein C8K15_13013 [Paenisporosarcina sp. OV554]
MKKKQYLKWVLLVLILGIGGYWYYSNNAIWGTSDNGMWKANYKKNSDETVGGWIGHIEQKSGGKVQIKEIRFTDNEKTLMKDGNFHEKRREDGEDRSVTKLDPFSTDFYLGNPPKKNHVYKLHITWEKKGHFQTDTFRLK